MLHQFAHVQYKDLNAKQQENYNFMKVSAVLADYGFATMRLSSDWQSADFIAQHIDGETFLKVQLKGRFWLDKKYFNKGLHIAFHTEEDWYIYPHDEVFQAASAEMNFAETDHWKTEGTHHRPTLSHQLRQLLEPYRLKGNRQTARKGTV